MLSSSESAVGLGPFRSRLAGFVAAVDRIVCLIAVVVAIGAVAAVGIVAVVVVVGGAGIAERRWSLGTCLRSCWMATSSSTCWLSRSTRFSSI